MPKFDTKVQELRYRILKEVAIGAFNENLNDIIMGIQKKIVPGPKPSMRCCIYKERAIVNERLDLILKASSKKTDNVIKVLQIACDECPLGGYTVTDACRGCIAHRCEQSCKKDAIYFDDDQRAHINKDKCVNCGLCAKNCPYNAIENRVRPCEKVCKSKAISPDVNGAAKIDDSKCIQCGNCVYMCPFGAIVDDSFVLEIIDNLKNNKNKKVAIIAPSISGNFLDVSFEKVVSGIKKLGFDEVLEAAAGADIVALSEGLELAEKGELTSSCCPAFVSYIRKKYPTLVDKISHNLSPMASIAKVVKEKDQDAYVVFIGPCTAKKQEIKLDSVKKYVDSAMTFEELQALFDAKEIVLSELEDADMDSASYYGRIFAKCGGLSEAVNEALKEQGIDFVAKSVQCDGISACNEALLKMKMGKLDGNFIEGMACVGGCIGGPCNLTHDLRAKLGVDKYSNKAKDKTIVDSVSKTNSK